MDQCGSYLDKSWNQTISQNSYNLVGLSSCLYRLSHEVFLACHALLMQLNGHPQYGHLNLLQVPVTDAPSVHSIHIEAKDNHKPFLVLKVILGVG